MSDDLEQALIDRLIDGELSGVERRDLLMRLDRSPDAWRRCALAFLEAQEWRKSFASLPAGGVHELGSGRFRPRRPPRDRRVPFRLSALAAGVMLAFLAGWVGRGAASRHGSPRSEDVPPPAAIAGRIGDRDPRQAPSIAPRSGPDKASELFNALPGAPDGREPRQADPVMDTVRRRWAGLGFEVEPERRVVAVRLEDGRVVTIPVEGISVQYVGQHPL